MKKKKVRNRCLRRIGALCMAAALSLSMLGTGTAFADTTDTGEEIVEMTDLGEYEATIDEAGGYVYYAFTPEESGTYRFYTTGDYDTYAYIYDADWNELDSDDDSGSDTNAKIAISLEAGNTYYIAIRFYSSNTTGSFSVCAEKVLAAVSAELVLSEDLILYEGIDSYAEYDDDDEAFEYYDYYELNFTSGDQIVLTLEDGSTVTCTSYGSVYFYDEDDNRLSFSCSSDQYSEHWEVGNTYYFTYTVTDYAIDVQIPVTIAENPYANATFEFVSEEGLTLYESIDSYTDYDDNGEEFEYYSYWNLSFSSGDQIVITCSDGSTITYTATVYGDFVDEDGNYLEFYVSSDQYSEPWEVGGTYYYTLYLYGYGLTVQIPVTIAENPYADATVEFVSEDVLTLYEGIDSYTDYDDDDEEFEYYSYWNLSFSSSDQIVITLSDGSTITYTSDGYGDFYDEDGNYLSYYTSSDQYSEHWEVGGTYYFTLTLSDYGLTVQIPVTIAENPYADATVEFVSEEGFTLYEGIDSYTYYDDDDEEYEYYSYWNLSFSSSDQIVITLSDGSTITYTSDGYGYFYDEDGNYLSYYVNSDQYSEHWETGGTYYYTMTLEDYGLKVQIPVTIAENPYADATVEFVSEEGLTLYEGIDSYTTSAEYYDEDTGEWYEEEYEYYDYWYLNFSSSDQIVITLSDGSTITYTSDGYGDFYDEDGNYLEFYESSDQYSEHWEIGGTYYYTLTLYDYGLTVQIPVTVEANPNDDDSSSDNSGTTGDDSSSTDNSGGTTGDDSSSTDNSGTTGDDSSSADNSGGTTGDDSSSTDNSGTAGDDSSSTDNSGTTGDDSSSADNSGTAGDGSTSDDDGSNGDISDDGNSSGEQDSGQTNGDSVKLKTQKITVKKSQLTKTIKYKKLKKKAQTFKLKASTSGNGKITYKKVSGNKKIKVSKAGKVTVKKGLKKGKTYKVKVKVTAAKTSTYEKATKTVTLKIKIK